MKKTEEIKLDYKLGVPYFSQYRDIDHADQKLYSCGMTNVYMALVHFGKNGQNLEQLVQQGIKDGGFTKSGWSHDYLVSAFKNHGLECFRQEKMLDRDVEKLHNALKQNNPVIISAQRRMFDRRIFHMVILTGYREDQNGNLEGFFYHDPASLNPEDAADLYVSVPVLLLDWRRMAIFPSLGK